MKRLLLPAILIFFSFLTINAQNSKDSNQAHSNDKVDKNSFSVQILKHGLGIDYERTIYKNFGLALSAGLAGAEIEAKYHFKPKINSASVGFGTGYTWYSNEDVTEGTLTYEVSRINMFFFEYRTQKKLVFTGGLGWFDLDGKARIRTRLGIGWYFPW